MKRALVLAALAGALIAGTWFAHRQRTATDPMDSAGRTWVKGRGVGHVVHLLDSGRYSAYRFCDVCQIRPSTGEWTTSADGYRLQPDAGGPAKVLRHTVFRGCPGLVEEGAAAPRFPTDVYFPKGDTCSASL